MPYQMSVNLGTTLVFCEGEVSSLDEQLHNCPRLLKLLGVQYEHVHVVQHLVAMVE